MNLMLVAMNNLLEGKETSFLLPVVILLGISVFLSTILSLFKIRFLPSFVVEMVVGILLRQIFYSSWIELEETRFSWMMDVLYVSGFVFIMFLSGYDNNFLVWKEQSNENQKTIHIRNLSFILLGIVFLVSFLLSTCFLKQYEHPFLGIILVGITISSTFAGIVVPLVQTEKIAKTSYGNILIYFSTISELFSVVLLTLFMILLKINWLRLLFYIGIFLIFILVWLIEKICKKNIEKINEGMMFLPVRLAIVALSGCVLLSDIAGGEYVLGAFLLGIFMKKLKVNSHVIHVMESIGFGLFIPIFFILVGLNFDIRIFISHPIWIGITLLLLLTFIVSKLPLLYLLRYYSKKASIVAVLLASCTLVVSIAVKHIGIEQGIFSPEFGESLVLASILSCILSPIIFEILFPFAIYKKKETLLEQEEEKTIS